MAHIKNGRTVSKNTIHEWEWVEGNFKHFPGDEAIITILKQIFNQSTVNFQTLNVLKK